MRILMIYFQVRIYIYTPTIKFHRFTIDMDEVKTL